KRCDGGRHQASDGSRDAPVTARRTLGRQFTRRTGVALHAVGRPDSFPQEAAVSISFSSVHALACGMLVMGFVAGGSARAQQFSGDMIRSSGQRTLDSSRVHVKGTKLRIENAAGGKDQYN